MFIASAIAFALVSGAPVFRLDYEYDGVLLRADREPAVFSHWTQRREHALPGDAIRITFIEDGEKTIQTLSAKQITTEVVHPDGSRQSMSGPLNSDKNPWKALIDQSKAMDIKQLYVKDPKEFKTVAGIRCRKHVYAMKVGDLTTETVEWRPVDPALADRLMALEKYDYSVDGDERKLVSASTVTSVRLGKAARR